MVTADKRMWLLAGASDFFSAAGANSCAAMARGTVNEALVLCVALAVQRVQ